MQSGIHASGPIAAARATAAAAMACIALACKADQPSQRSNSTMKTTTQPTHTNRLIHATSPYLLQHAHNPVDWYPWGAEALERAAREDKPIFLSIGYAACHWCHVMERESFESEEIAEILNRHFVSIKVDREERPDLDDIYMKATQIYNQGGGGWPMSVFLLPDGKPFFAGTYFPPESRYGRPGFKDLLNEIARLWKDERQKISEGAKSLTEALQGITERGESGPLIPPETITRTVDMLSRAFDRRHGGISGGGTNKFPPSMAMDLMLREYHRTSQAGTPRKEMLDLVELTLARMANGGIYDQLGGGFARYSTDVEWLAPHFEKMLYDQGLVSGIYLDAYQVTGKPLYARIARETFDYCVADLQSPEGGFYSSRDADSEGVEGKFYIWSRGEIEQALGTDAELFCSFYDVSDGGNWEGHNILRVTRDAATVAKLNRVPVEELERRLAAARAKLLDIRSRRVPPGLDDKVLASWNGLMIASLARGSRVLDDARYRAAAAKAADMILARLRREDGRLLRTYRAGKAHTLAYLDDHAFMIEGLLNLYEATGEVRWLDAAAALTLDVQKYFADPAGGYFFTPDDGEKLLLRARDAEDGAIPSGNSVHAMNLLRLSVLLDDKQMLANAEGIFKGFSQTVQRFPTSAERMLAAVDFHSRRPKEVVFVMPVSPVAPVSQPVRDAVATMNDPLQAALWRAYVPNKVIAHLPYGAPQAEALTERIPLLAGRVPLEGRPTAYVCKNFACQAPTTDPVVLAEQLRN